MKPTKKEEKELERQNKLLLVFAKTMLKQLSGMLKSVEKSQKKPLKRKGNGKRKSRR